MHAQTRRQREVLDLIARYIDTHGYRPSYQVIARHLGLRSRAGIARIVHDLESQGLLTRRREEGHFYLDMNGGDESVPIHWLEIPVGAAPRNAWQDGPIWLPKFMIGDYEPESLRAYLVTDNSMAAEKICEDDVALVEYRDYARDGQTVVAVLNNTQTILRKYYRSGSEVEFCSGKDGDGESLKFAADRVQLAGVYRGLIRPAV
ncbi:MAG: S24 family peptidase [Pyrinomonadaceae bacterium]